MAAVIGSIAYYMRIAGKALPLRIVEGKYGLYAALVAKNKDGSWSKSPGVKMPALTDTLPTMATLCQAVNGECGPEIVTFALERGVTQDFTDKKTGKVSPGGKPRAKGASEPTLSTPFGDDRNAHAAVSLQPDGTWYVDTGVRAPGGGGNSKVIGGLEELY